MTLPLKEIYADFHDSCFYNIHYSKSTDELLLLNDKGFYFVNLKVK